jgi:3-dehydroquinate synthase
MRELFTQIWSEFSIADLDVDVLIDALKKDKKNVDNQLGLILNKGAGKVFKDFTDPDETFRSWMIEYMETYHKNESK